MTYLAENIENQLMSINIDMENLRTCIFMLIAAQNLNFRWTFVTP